LAKSVSSYLKRVEERVLKSVQLFWVTLYTQKQGHGSVGLKAEVKLNRRTDGQTDRPDCSMLPANAAGNQTGSEVSWE